MQKTTREEIAEYAQETKMILTSEPLKDKERSAIAEVLQAIDKLNDTEIASDA